MLLAQSAGLGFGLRGFGFSLCHPARDPFQGEDIHVHFPAGGIPKDGMLLGARGFSSQSSLVLFGLVWSFGVL